MADMDMSEKNVRITDIREWIFEAIDKIGAPVQYIQKETEPIKICEGQVMIPDDLNSLISVAFMLMPPLCLVSFSQSLHSLTLINILFTLLLTYYSFINHDEWQCK